MKLLIFSLLSLVSFSTFAATNSLSDECRAKLVQNYERADKLADRVRRIADPTTHHFSDPDVEGHNAVVWTNALTLEGTLWDLKHGDVTSDANSLRLLDEICETPFLNAKVLYELL